MNFSDLVAKDSAKAKAAKERLNVRVTSGAKQQEALITQVMNTVIVDRLRYPAELTFDHTPQIGSSIAMLDTREIRVRDKHIRYSLHNHALGQLAGVLDVPRTFVSKLRDGEDYKKDLLCTVLNTLLHKGAFTDRRGNDAQFLLRLVGTELRGFLSRNYNRKLVTAPLLRSFIEACGLVHAAPVEAVSTDIRMSLKCMLPYVFEPVDGEFVSLGVTMSNSDFGAGKTRVSGTAMRISSGTLSVMEDSLSRVHLGSVIEESDIELSDETLDKELAAHQSAIKDAVTGQLSYDNVEKVLRAIQIAHELVIPWYKLKNQLAAVLQKKEVDMVEELLKKGGEDIVDLPPPHTTAGGDRQATGWWTANVLGWMANRQTDADKKQDLQQLAGRMLGE